MISLKNISKSYTLKGSKPFKAVDDISLNLPKTGFVFLIGKSGSGKSTLLNLMGGLDKYDSGDLLINNQPITGLNKKDIDSYRNTYIGFIFQEFNLIEHYNVFQNVCLALDLQGIEEDKEKKVSEILKKVELLDKSSNKVNELSGGQKQRVAIARALVKNPDLVLADEPTGNLDSVTSTLILDLLKKLSKDKLIVMVSHDTEYANEYADRIIELKDGKIIKDDKPGDNSVKTLKKNNQEKLNLIHAKLPMKTKISMSMNSIINRKLKIILTLLILTTSVLIYGISDIVGNFDYGNAVEETMSIDENQVFKISNGFKQSADSTYVYPSNYTNEEVEELEMMFPDSEFYVSNGAIGLFDLGKLDSHASDLYKPDAIERTIQVNDINDLGFDFTIGNMPVADNEVVISDYIADHYLNEDSSKNSYEDIIGNQLVDASIIVSGIFKTNYESYSELENFKSQNQDNLPKQKYAEWMQLKPILESLIINEGQYDDLIKEQMNMDMWRSSYNQNYTESVTLDDKKLYGDNVNYANLKVAKYDMDYLSNNIGDIITSEPALSVNGLRDGEILINHSFIEAVTGISLPQNATYEDLVNSGITDMTTMLNISYGKSMNETKFFEQEMNIVGTYRPDIIGPYNNSVFMINDFTFNKMNSKDIELFVNPQVKSSELFDYLKNNDNIISSPKVDYVVNFASGYTSMAPLLFYLSITLALFSSVLFFNNISGSILDKKKEIGTLRAIGATGKDIAKIFLVESILLVIITLLFALIGLNIFMIILNSGTKELIGYSVNIFRVDFIVSAKLIVTCFLIGVLTSIIPSLKVSKMKPIDAIEKR